MKVQKMFKNENELLVRTWIIGEDSNGGLRLIITNATEIVAATDVLTREELEKHLKVQLDMDVESVIKRNIDDTNPLYVIDGEKK
jgi:hypothetical protein